MTDLATLADLAEIFGALTVVGGILFALMQLRQFQRQRLEQAAIDLVKSVQSRDFLDAARVVMELPDDVAIEVIDRDPDVRLAINQMGYTLGYMGVLVFHRVVPLHIVDDLVGGLARRSWAKLKVYADHRRQKVGTPQALAWFQWLAEQLERSAAGGRDERAHIVHRDWRP